MEKNTNNSATAPDFITGHDVATDCSEWHVRFSIPDLSSFSHHVKEAVTTGVITARARKEVNQVLRTYITAYTIRPSSEQYTTVCKKLIEKYPSLKDTKGKTKYVSINNFSFYRTFLLFGQSSWKLGLRNSFKNFRRGSNKGSSESEEPPSKRLRLYDANQPDNLTDEEYEQAIKELQGNYYTVFK